MHDPRLAGELAAGVLERYKHATLSDPDVLLDELGEVVASGWASDVEELDPGVASIGAAIENRKRAAIGAVATSGAIERLCSDRSPRIDLAQSVMECGRAVSRELGRTAW